MTELANVKPGSETEFTVEFKDGKLKLSFGYDGKGVDAGVYADVEAEYLLDKIADAIPGKVDDAILAAFKGALT